MACVFQLNKSFRDDALLCRKPVASRHLHPTPMMNPFQVPPSQQRRARRPGVQAQAFDYTGPIQLETTGRIQ